MSEKFSIRFFLIFSCLSSCATYVTPVGSWQFSPSMFSVNNSPLGETKIKLECGTGDRNQSTWKTVNTKACDDTARILEEYDVLIIGEYASEVSLDSEDEENESKEETIIEADFNLILVERGNKLIGTNSSLVCYYSATIFPCISKVDTELELIFTDKNGNVITRRSIRSHITEVSGIGALFYVFGSYLESVKNYKQNVLPNALATYIVNLVQSVNFKVKQKNFAKTSI